MNQFYGDYRNGPFGIPTNPVQQRPYNNGIIWVQGYEGAKSYIMQPNSNAILLDSETEGRFYIKVSDNIGMCSLRIFNFTEVESDNQNGDVIDVKTSQYATKKELNELKQLINSLKGGADSEQFVRRTKPNNSQQ